MLPIDLEFLSMGFEVYTVTLLKVCRYFLKLSIIGQIDGVAYQVWLVDDPGKDELGSSARPDNRGQMLVCSGD